ncbi:uncharacterized protein LOC111274161 [Durio zibethinus]|uniref:Uncharacterized protein LOC111274161 n=1 Tax=Durio zibethinus TaxID=66656 RepID=A0A6P5WES6_DURZI|nr:uncharacterized protein LOC111274161 [Durio zibethinus]
MILPRRKVKALMEIFAFVLVICIIQLRIRMENFIFNFSFSPHNNSLIPTQFVSRPADSHPLSPTLTRKERTLTNGKVHGSLVRACKVRGQTPKVAKQDKKKKPRGRAYKRMQYKRRFVTAVVGFGRKRGPNSSEM